jgi:hypothetical protein
VSTVGSIGTQRRITGDGASGAPITPDKQNASRLREASSQNSWGALIPRFIPLINGRTGSMMVETPLLPGGNS